jgi:hypothetical protein
MLARGTKEHAMSQTLKGAIAVVGIDIGKNSFHVVGLDQRGAIVLRQKWSRGQVDARFANMPPCLVGMEACVGAHHLSRKLKMLGLRCQADVGEVRAALFEGTEERLPRRGGDFDRLTTAIIALTFYLPTTILAVKGYKRREGTGEHQFKIHHAIGRGRLSFPWRSGAQTTRPRLQAAGGPVLSCRRRGIAGRNQQPHIRP